MSEADLLGAGAWYLVLVLLLAFGSSIIGTLSGFGGSLLVMPFLMPVVGVKGTIPVMTVAMLLGNGSRIWVNRENLDFRAIRWLVAAAVPGTVLGTMIYDRLPPRAVAVVIGCVMILTVPLRNAMRGRAVKPPPAGAAAIGFGFGVMTGSSPGAGTVMIAVLLGMGLTGPALIGTDAMIGVSINVVKAMMFGSLGLLGREWALLGLLIGTAMIPGAYAGRWLVRRLSVRAHIAIIETLVVASGISFLWRAWKM